MKKITLRQPERRRGRITEHHTKRLFDFLNMVFAAHKLSASEQRHFCVVFIFECAIRRAYMKTDFSSDSRCLAA